MIDAVFLPLSIAWAWRMNFETVSGTILSLSIYISLFFWTIDIILNLNTAVYIQGQLVFKRRRILIRYLRTWFFLDVSDLSGKERQEDGKTSWIDLALAADLDGATQYITSLRYIMNAPAPPLIAPDSVRERLVDIMNNIFCLAVCLEQKDASFELTTRIMKFVDYKLDKISPVTFDSSLISMTLQTELYVSQRGQYMELLPICTKWFEELALYGEGVIHHATLSARTFSEVLTLEREDGTGLGTRATGRSSEPNRAPELCADG
eukprot:Skav220061  [mRNA]  locus=scaffold1709:116943:126732:- [translate_table: standard]